MRILITGAGGFVGTHLAKHIVENEQDIQVTGTVFKTDAVNNAFLTESYQADLRDYDRVLEVVKTVQPDHIYHLAAQAFVPRSFEAPWETLETNIRSELNILQACIELGIMPHILIISSAEIYGAVSPEELPLTETSPFRPANPYSVSKVTQDMLGYQYYLSYKLPIMRARPFNHFGPGQSERFVAAAFSSQIARIEAGLQEPVLNVGNLSAKRDFTDVRDIVRAYRMIIDKGNVGDVYNIASGKAFSIQYLLDTLLSYTKVEIDVRVDPERLRPIDVPEVRGDCTRLHEATGWQPQIAFEQTLHDLLDECRQRNQTN